MASLRALAAERAASLLGAVAAQPEADTLAHRVACLPGDVVDVIARLADAVALLRLEAACARVWLVRWDELYEARFQRAAPSVRVRTTHHAAQSVCGQLALATHGRAVHAPSGGWRLGRPPPTDTRALYCTRVCQAALSERQASAECLDGASLAAACAAVWCTGQASASPGQTETEHVRDMCRVWSAAGCGAELDACAALAERLVVTAASESVRECLALVRRVRALCLASALADASATLAAFGGTELELTRTDARTMAALARWSGLDGLVVLVLTQLRVDALALGQVLARAAALDAFELRDVRLDGTAAAVRALAEHVRRTRSLRHIVLVDGDASDACAALVLDALAEGSARRGVGACDGGALELVSLAVQWGDAIDGERDEQAAGLSDSDERCLRPSTCPLPRLAGERLAALSLVGMTPRATRELSTALATGSLGALRVLALEALTRAELVSVFGALASTHVGAPRLAALRVESVRGEGVGVLWSPAQCDLFARMLDCQRALAELSLNYASLGGAMHVLAGASTAGSLNALTLLSLASARLALGDRAALVSLLGAPPPQLAVLSLENNHVNSIELRAAAALASTARRAVALELVVLETVSGGIERDDVLALALALGKENLAVVGSSARVVSDAVHAM